MLYKPRPRTVFERGGQFLCGCDSRLCASKSTVLTRHLSLYARLHVNYAVVAISDESPERGRLTRYRQ